MAAPGDMLPGALAWALVHLLWQGTAVALALGLVLAATRGHDAQLRYASACLALAIIAAAPIATVGWLLREAPGLIAAPGVRGWLAGSGVSDAVVRGHFVLPDLAPWILGLWAAGALTLLARGVGGWWMVRRLVAQAHLAAPAVQEAADRLRERLRVRQPVTVLVSERVCSPSLIGWRRPAIVLPARTGTTPAATETEMLLAHELSHVRRGDYLVNGLQLLVEALLFFHPAAWWISRRVREEREHCCDDAVVRLFRDPFGYSRALYRAAENRQSPGHPALGAGGGQLLARIRRLSAPRPAPHRLAGPAAALTAPLLLGWLAAATPPLLGPAALSLGGGWMEVRAHDPAGEFSLSLVQGRVVAATLDRSPVPAERLVQHGDSVRVLAASGERLLAVEVVPGGIRWDSRPPPP